MTQTLHNHLHLRHRGVFICFEGGEACGKTTQITLLDQYLRNQGVSPVVTREPGGTPLGAALRHQLLHAGDVSARAEALLYAADRAHHVATVIEPALSAGKVVITDRYQDSSIAYQGVARGMGAVIAELSQWATDGLVPDLTILLDADPQLVALRRDRISDRLESEPLQFHRQVRQAFLDIAHADPQRYLICDATADIADIAHQVNQRVSTLIAGERP